MWGVGTYTFSSGTRLEGTFEDNQLKSATFDTTNDIGKYKITVDSGEIKSVDMTLANGVLYKGGVKDGELTGTKIKIYIQVM